MDYKNNLELKYKSVEITLKKYWQYAVNRGMKFENTLEYVKKELEKIYDQEIGAEKLEQLRQSINTLVGFPNNFDITTPIETIIDSDVKEEYTNNNYLKYNPIFRDFDDYVNTLFLYHAYRSIYKGLNDCRLFYQAAFDIKPSLDWNAPRMLPLNEQEKQDKAILLQQQVEKNTPNPMQELEEFNQSEITFNKNEVGILVELFIIPTTKKSKENKLDKSEMLFLLSILKMDFGKVYSDKPRNSGIYKMINQGGIHSFELEKSIEILKKLYVKLNKIGLNQTKQIINDYLYSAEVKQAKQIKQNKSNSDC